VLVLNRNASKGINLCHAVACSPLSFFLFCETHYKTYKFTLAYLYKLTNIYMHIVLSLSRFGIDKVTIYVLLLMRISSTIKKIEP
jgi:hypothetical protein